MEVWLPALTGVGVCVQALNFKAQIDLCESLSLTPLLWFSSVVLQTMEPGVSPDELRLLVAYILFEDPSHDYKLSLQDLKQLLAPFAAPSGAVL